MQFLKLSKYKSSISILCFVIFFISSHPEINGQKKYTVVLDAGHGGKDPGNLGNGYQEKKIALKVVLEVGKQLKKNKDIKVIYTRNKDVFVELHNRAKIANNNKADLFVSIHCDSYTDSKAHGAGTFVLGLSGNKQNLEMAKRENAVILLEDNYQQNYDYDPNSPESVISLSMLQEENLDESLLFADLVQDHFSLARRHDRSVKQNNFLVLRETVMPSVLIELGFLTNKTEGKFLNSSSGQLRMANAIAKGIEKYVERIKLNTIQDRKTLEKTKKASSSNNKMVTTTEIKKSSEKKKESKGNLDKKDVSIEVAPPKNKEIVIDKPAKIEFKVQIAASKKYLPENNFNFKGFKNIEVLVIDEYYKYYCASSENFKKAKEALVEARNAGYKDAFIVAFSNGTKISLAEALKK